MRIGILTGGGDCPGLNAVIRAVVRKGSVDHIDASIIDTRARAVEALLREQALER